MSSSSIYPVVMPSMPQQEFQSCMIAQKQNCLLYDPEQIKEELAQGRRLERERVKSSLKREEMLYKQTIQLTSRTFFERQGAVWMQDINGAGQVVREICGLSCLIRGIRRYTREGKDDELFQLIIKDGKNEISSNLYEAEILKSPIQLQRTILCGYDETCSQQDKTAVWKWLWRELISLYDKAEKHCLPALPGWYKAGEHYHLWAGNRSCDLLMNKEIRDYKLRYTKGAETTKISKAFEQKEIENEEALGTLLLIRLIALTGRLCTAKPIAVSVILYGNSALSVAKELLSVSDSEDNIINLESDRLNVIRRKISRLRENVAIFVLHSTESRSTRNRIRDVDSWVSSGYVEGDKVTIPYIFCTKKLSHDMPLENSILLDADSIFGEEWKAPFTIVQSWWVDMIEKSGTLLVERLQAAVRQKQTEKKAVIRSITESIAEEMAGLMNCDTGEAIFSVLRSGVEMLNSQMAMKYEHILTIFNRQVVQMSERHQITFLDTADAGFVDEDMGVYYDADFYYFPNSVLESICSEAKIDRKSLLAVKQQLISLELVKLYRNNGKHSRELQIDIPVRSKNGSRRYIAVLAIRRKFWDDDFGICLYERR